MGLDLYFPNAGAYPGNSQSDRTRIDRQEDIDVTPAASFSQIRQIVRANGREAVIARTIHGYPLIVGDKNTLLNATIQLGAAFVPHLVPQIKGSGQPVNTSINKNLFLAANNSRLPLNSFTIYQAGLGHAMSTSGKAARPDDIPSATFNGVWVGVSPVIERSFSRRLRYEVPSPTRSITTAGAEGGMESNTSVTSVVNQQGYSTASLQNFYTQLYLGIFDRDVDLVTRNQQIEKTSYSPHISFTGNTTRTDSLFRYYGIRAQHRLGKDYNNPTLILAWSKNQYDYGFDQLQRDLVENDNVFSLQFGWGEPSRPFAPQTGERIRKQLDGETERLRRDRLRESEPQAPVR